MRRNTSRNRYATTLLLLTATLAAKKIHAQWDIEESHTTASLRGIHNVGAGVAWASGTNGTVLRTEDGGYLWQTCTIPPGAEKLDFRGIQAFDENTAIVMSSGLGDLSRLYKTTDGCQTWKLLFTNPDKEGFWDALQFQTKHFDQPSLNGILIGDPVQGKFPIFVTTDGGENWRRWGRSGSGRRGPCGERNAKSSKGEALFAASNQSLIFGGANDFLFVTGGTSGSRVIFTDVFVTDYGPPCWTSFTSNRIPMATGSTSSGAFATAMTHWDGWLPERMMIVGGDFTKPDDPSNTSLFLAQRSSHNVLFQGPFEKTEAAQTLPHGYRSSVAYDPTQKLWITVGPNGTDISTDDGKNWHPLTPSGYDPPDADKNWNALSLPFVVGPHGRIGRLRTIPNPHK
jgi:hypothetical protein